MMLSVVLTLFLYSITNAGLTVDTPEKCLSGHNQLRNLHKNTPNLVWDVDLENAAQKYAEHLRDGNSKLIHDPENEKNGWGENLFWKDGYEEAKCAHASLKWYNEIADYDFATGHSSNGRMIGHFTQAVWNTTTKLGVGIATKSEGGKYISWVVAKYSPPGNVLNRFKYSVNGRKPGANTPELHELDYSICRNIFPRSSCDGWIETHGCVGVYKSVCYKLCTNC